MKWISLMRLGKNSPQVIIILEKNFVSGIGRNITSPNTYLFNSGSLNSNNNIINNNQNKDSLIWDMSGGMSKLINQNNPTSLETLESMRRNLKNKFTEFCIMFVCYLTYFIA